MAPPAGTQGCAGHSGGMSVARRWHARWDTEDQMYRLDNTVQHYAWGSRTYLPELLGVDVDGRPFAELWMGTHPVAPSRVASDRLPPVGGRSPSGGGCSAVGAPGRR